MKVGFPFSSRSFHYWELVLSANSRRSPQEKHGKIWLYNQRLSLQNGRITIYQNIYIMGTIYGLLANMVYCSWDCFCVLRVSGRNKKNAISIKHTTKMVGTILFCERSMGYIGILVDASFKPNQKGISCDKHR